MFWDDLNKDMEDPAFRTDFEKQLGIMQEVDSAMNEEGPYHLHWSEPDNEWVATHDGFPSLSWLDKDRDVALARLKAIIDDFDVNHNGINDERLV